jgi:SAM-dependent methyltransferase
VQIAFVEGLSSAPPFAPSSFDHVLSSLLFHHLSTENKRRTLAQVYSLLRPGGGLHLADWGQAQDALMRLAFLPVQLLDGFETTADNVAGRLVSLMLEAGFQDAAQLHHERTILGTLALYRGMVTALV